MNNRKTYLDGWLWTNVRRAPADYARPTSSFGRSAVCPAPSTRCKPRPDRHRSHPAVRHFDCEKFKILLTHNLCFSIVATFNLNIISGCDCCVATNRKNVGLTVSRHNHNIACSTQTQLDHTPRFCREDLSVQVVVTIERLLSIDIRILFRC